MRGLGTNDLSLIRTVVARCEIDMVQIKEEFERAYKQPLGKFIAVSDHRIYIVYCLFIRVLVISIGQLLSILLVSNFELP